MDIKDFLSQLILGKLSVSQVSWQQKGTLDDK